MFAAFVNIRQAPTVKKNLALDIFNVKGSMILRGASFGLVRLRSPQVAQDRSLRYSSIAYRAVLLQKILFKFYLLFFTSIPLVSAVSRSLHQEVFPPDISAIFS